jgi:hypothetical protein
MAGQYLSPATPVSYTNKTDFHNITGCILLNSQLFNKIHVIDLVRVRP